MKLGRYDEALEKGLSYGVYFKEGEWKGHYLNLVGRVYAHRFEWDLALQYQEWAYQIRIEVGDMEFVGQSLNRMGTTYMGKGELDKSIEYYKQSIVIAEETGDDNGRATTLTNMGSALIVKGEIDEAKEALEESLDILTGLGMTLFTTKALLGFIYFSEGDFEKAVEYIEPMYKFHKELGDQEYTARDLVYLFDIFIMRDREKAKEYLDELEEIEKDERSSRINLDFKFASALYLKSSKRNRDKARSELLFEEIITSDSGYKIRSITHLIELLLFEYKTYAEKEVLDEIYTHLETLDEYSKRNYTYPLLIKIQIIKSQLEMVEGNFDDAEKILQNARQLAEEKNLKMLLQDVVDAQDSMVQELQEMKILLQKNATVAQRLEKLSIMSYIEKAQRLMSK